DAEVDRAEEQVGHAAGVGPDPGDVAQVEVDDDHEAEGDAFDRHHSGVAPPHEAAVREAVARQARHIERVALPHRGHAGGSRLAPRHGSPSHLSSSIASFLFGQYQNRKARAGGISPHAKPGTDQTDQTSQIVTESAATNGQISGAGYA